jgi:hypothetical protein
MILFVLGLICLLGAVFVLSCGDVSGPDNLGFGMALAFIKAVLITGLVTGWLVLWVASFISGS